MAAEWYCEIGGQRLGPLSPQQLRALVDEGRLTAGDRVAQRPDGPWVQAGRVKGLFVAAGSPPPLPKKVGVPAAKAPANPAQGAKREPRRAVRTLDVPAVQPVEQSSPKVAASVRPKVPPAQDSPGPPPPAEPVAPGDLGIAPISIVTSDSGIGRGSTSMAGGAAAAAPARKRRQNLMLVGSLAVAGVGLAIAGLVLAVGGNSSLSSSPDSSGTPSQLAAKAMRREKEELATLERFDRAPLEAAVPASASVQKGQGVGVDAKTPETAADQAWVDASKSDVQRGSVRVRIVSAEMGYPVFARNLRNPLPPDKCLLLRVRLENLDAARKLEYRSWTAPNPMSRGARLTDDLQNVYHAQSFHPAQVKGQLASASIYPDQAVDDLLIFQRPVPKAKALQLELPAGAFGQTGSVRFKIPAEMIVEAKEPAAATEAPQQKVGSSEQPARPLRQGVPEIDRALEELDREAADEGDEDPDGDVSQILRDIEAIGGGDRPKQDENPSAPEERVP